MIFLTSTAEFIDPIQHSVSDCKAAELLTEHSSRPDDQASRISRLLMLLDHDDRQPIVGLVERLVERLSKTCS